MKLPERAPTDYTLQHHAFMYGQKYGTTAIDNVLQEQGTVS